MGDMVSDALLEACPDGLILMDASGGVVWANPAGVSLLGLGGKPLSDFFSRIHTDDRHTVRQTLLDSRPGETLSLDFRIWPEDGGEVGVNARIRNGLRGPGSRGYLMSLREAEVTGALLQAVNLRARSGMLSAIMEKLPILACRIDRNGVVRESFGGGFRNIGVKDGQRVGDNVFQTWPALRTDLQRAFAGETVQFEIEVGQNEPRTMEVRLFPDSEESGGILGFGMDVTERKLAEAALHRSEDQLRQGQKMEAMGRLAGGVAHDFNNLLTAINGYAEILAHAMQEEDPLRGNVEEIRRAGDRAASLTRQLLTFSRRQILTRRVVNLNDSVAEVREMLVRLIGEDVQLETIAAPDLATVSADPGQIEQVILNLALNSRDAMPKGGRLLIETSNVHLDPRQSGVFFAIHSGPGVRLTVTDTGTGMTDEIKSHIFEPFFTTKPQGQGTGLGLCTVYGIVQQAGGNISVRSEPGMGTSISVYLPALERKAIAENPPPASDGALASENGGETVLLVEDEEVVRRLVSELLVRQGYRVLTAASGKEALEIAGRHPEEIDLLLTDVVMAGMSGRELAEKLLAGRPLTRVLYMSGYTDDAILRHGVSQGGGDFLSKPFSSPELIRKVRQMLGAPAQASRPAGAAAASVAGFASEESR
jgi:signal transduction histidine kinase/FixJ family two-component response regulator